ncbi:MAG: hypothetical protein QF662_08335, partial [Phycisphaerae bacterium]|nr:hypothetical protein [Phycisphaerae bacterium]
MMRMRFMTIIICFALASVLAAGCGPKREPPRGPPPIIGQEEVISFYNANCARIGHLWSRAKIRVQFPKTDKSGKPVQPAKYEVHDMDGHLVVHKPDKMFLQGAVIGSPMFNLGSNEKEYWLWLKPADNTVWIGRRKGASGGGGFGRMALELPEALGIYPLRVAKNQLALFTRYPEHNGIEVVELSGKRAFVSKRFWFDRWEHVLVRIDFFLPDGSCVMSSRLADFADIDGVKIARKYLVRL